MEVINSVKNKIIFLTTTFFFVSANVFAEKKLPETQKSETEFYVRNLIQVDPIETEVKAPIAETETTPTEVSLLSKLSATYFLFFSGPGITQETHSFPPNELGRPDFTGLNSFNVISFRYKFNDKYNIDLQTRSRVVFNNGTNSNNFDWFIWESPRIGVSGKLMSGENWSLSGAVNTDFPYTMPTPFTGYTARERTVLFNPGMFANFNYKNPVSKWSYNVLLTPRYFVYKDDNKLEPEGVAAGFSGANKPHLVISLSPSINYEVSDKLAWSATTTIEFIKQVGSDWDPTQLSLVSNSRSKEWAISGIPIMFGPKYTHSSSLTIYPFVQFFPIEKQRENANSRQVAPIEETISVGMWVSGGF